jgi:hypothetical protein
MAFSAQVCKVMIASPSDVIEERRIVREILHSWNDVNSAFRKLVLLPIGWETNTTPEMGDHPQEIINRQILKDADILIGIFWTRLGTSTREYKSGTVEEIEKHVKAGKAAKLYFSTAPVHPDSVDHEQYEALKEFKAKCRDLGLLETFTDVADFRAKFSRHLQLELNQDSYRQPEATATPTALSNATIQLSIQAQELLLNAVEDNNGHIMHLRHLGGEDIQTNNKNFIEDRSPRSAALWNGAIKELVRLGLISDVGYEGEMYAVTNEGYEWAGRHNAAMPLELGLELTGNPPQQTLFIQANKKIKVSRVDYMLSNEASVSGEDVTVHGTEVKIPINDGLLLTLWNSPRPDKVHYDHSGPAKLGVTVSCGEKKYELILPVLLEAFLQNNTMYRKISGRKTFSGLT